MGLSDEEIRRYERYYDAIDSGKLSDETVRRIISSEIGWEPVMIDKETAKKWAVWILFLLVLLIGIYSVWFALQGGG